MARRYRSPVREEQAAATRDALLRAFAEQLGDAPAGGGVEVRVPEAADHAGVAVRTAYHHFPDRRARLAEVAAWADEELGPLPSIDGVDDLPDHVRRTYARAAAQPDLARALHASGLADEARARRLRARSLEIAALLTGIGAPSAPTTHATAVVSLLSSVDAAVPLVDAHGLSVEEAAEAAAEAVAAVVASLRAQRRERITT